MQPAVRWLIVQVLIPHFVGLLLSIDIVDELKHIVNIVTVLSCHDCGVAMYISTMKSNC